MDNMAVFAGMLFVMLAAVIRSSVAYDDGAPVSTCQSMYPGHANFTSKSSTAPFAITVGSSTNCYTPGKVLTG